MGIAKKRREAFFKANPICIYCGGLVPATTEEHCPPKAMFENKKWPEGFSFGACAACNLGTSRQDLMIALLARIGPSQDETSDKAVIEKLLASVERLFPGIVGRMMPTPVEARKQNRELNIQPALGLTHQDVGIAKLPEEFHRAVEVFSAKLAKSIFFLEAKTIFPAAGCIAMHWFSNAEILKHGNYPLIEQLRSMSGNVPELKRDRNFLNPQFEYKASLSPDHKLFVLQSLIGNSFGLVIFASSEAGFLEGVLEKLAREKGKPNPLKILQPQPILDA